MSLTKEQIERRRHALGASEVAAALGLSKYRTPLQVYLEKRGEAPPFEDKREFRFGHAVEPFIIGEFEIEKNVTLVRSPDSMQRGDLITHLDALLPAHFSVQAKTARNKEGWGEPETDNVPVDYWMQVQAEMLVSGLTLAYIPVLFYGSEFCIYQVNADPAVQAQIEAGASEFMDRVRRGIPPPPVSLPEVNQLYKVSIPRAVAVPAEIASTVDTLASLRSTIAMLEQDAAAMEARIKAAMTDHEVAMFQGKVLATWKSSKPSEKLDIKRLLTEHPELAAKYNYFAEPVRKFLLKV